MAKERKGRNCNGRLFPHIQAFIRGLSLLLPSILQFLEHVRGNVKVFVDYFEKLITGHIRVLHAHKVKEKVCLHLA